MFIFSQVGFIPRRVTLAYLDLGGNENISVNGDPFPAFIGELANAPPAMGGANVVVTPSSGGAGKVEIDGAVFILKIGGQEFWLDDVCAHVLAAECPTRLACLEQ